MDELTQLLNEINTSVVYKKIRELEIDREYEVKSMELVKTKYGKCICVKLVDFQVTLPKSWTEKLNDEAISKLSQSKIHLVYKGIIHLANGNTKLDIKFV